jgi:hypothetical protein
LNISYSITTKSPLSDILYKCEIQSKTVKESRISLVLTEITSIDQWSDIEDFWRGRMNLRASPFTNYKLKTPVASKLTLTKSGIGGSQEELLFTTSIL